MQVPYFCFRTSRRIPVGYKFLPTDEELVCDYLWNKVKGNPLPYNDVIREADLYGDQEPWEIWETFGGSSLLHKEDLYFFTRQKKKSSNGSRIDRTIGSNGGSWNGDSKSNELRARNVKWTQSKFHYKSKDSMRVLDSQWLMQEYRIVDSSLNGPNSNYVLCRLRRIQKKRKLEGAMVVRNGAIGESSSTSQLSDFDHSSGNEPRRLKFDPEKNASEGLEGGMAVPRSGDVSECSSTSQIFESIHSNTEPIQFTFDPHQRDSEELFGMLTDFNFTYEELWGEDANFEPNNITTSSSGQN